MLVLSRRESERIRIGDSVVVTVVRLTRDRVRIGIEAPSDVLVLRDELEKDEDVIELRYDEEYPVHTRKPTRRPGREGTLQEGTKAERSVALQEEEPCQAESARRPYFRRHRDEVDEEDER